MSCNTGVAHGSLGLQDQDGVYALMLKLQAY